MQVHNILQHGEPIQWTLEFQQNDARLILVVMP